MNLPYFFKEDIDFSGKEVVFDEESSKHIVQVLRMKPGELLQVTDGKGKFITAEIIGDHKKRCAVKILSSKHTARSFRKRSIAISLLKNTSRFEWFLEKATEIGVQEVIPLICERTEKQHFRHERMKNICTSAMLQSQQVWLPDLHQPKSFKALFGELRHHQKFIAHCLEKEKRSLADLIDNNLPSQVILIGPEGDFTDDEIEFAINHECLPVTLGETRLRTETAGIVAAAILVNS
jgi:16S rRNA (uracil1498-N3)-methyltransferase